MLRLECKLGQVGKCQLSGRYAGLGHVILEGYQDIVTGINGNFAAFLLGCLRVEF